MTLSMQEGVECGICGVIGDFHNQHSYSDQRKNYASTLRRSSSERTVMTLESGFESEDQEMKYKIRLLARRTMHLPHYTYWQDYLQFFSNNHPLFGMCLHHPLHPLQRGHRLWMLLASIAFGLATTNIIYLYYVVHDDEVDKVLLDIELSEISFGNFHALTVTYGMMTLWTFGGVLHTIFDLMMWYLSACSCFMTGVFCFKRSRLKLIGMYSVIAVTAILIVLAIFVVTLRAAYEQRLRQLENGQEVDEITWDELAKVRNFSFIVGYIVELLLVYLCYYPFITFALFNGIVPCLGRHKEIQRQKREREDRIQKMNKTTHPVSSSLEEARVDDNDDEEYEDFYMKASTEIEGRSSCQCKSPPTNYDAINKFWVHLSELISTLPQLNIPNVSFLQDKKDESNDEPLSITRSSSIQPIQQKNQVEHRVQIDNGLIIGEKEDEPEMKNSWFNISRVASALPHITLPQIQVSMEEDVNAEEIYIIERKKEIAKELEEEKQRAAEERMHLERILISEICDNEMIMDTTVKANIEEETINDDLGRSPNDNDLHEIVHGREEDIPFSRNDDDVKTDEFSHNIEEKAIQPFVFDHYDQQSKEDESLRGNQEFFQVIDGTKCLV